MKFEETMPVKKEQDGKVTFEGNGFHGTVHGNKLDGKNQFNVDLEYGGRSVSAFALYSPDTGIISIGYKDNMNISCNIDYEDDGTAVCEGYKILCMNSNFANIKSGTDVVCNLSWFADSITISINTGEDIGDTLRLVAVLVSSTVAYGCKKDCRNPDIMGIVRSLS